MTIERFVVHRQRLNAVAKIAQKRKWSSPISQCKNTHTNRTTTTRWTPDGPETRPSTNITHKSLINSDWIWLLIHLLVLLLFGMCNMHFLIAHSTPKKNIYNNCCLWSVPFVQHNTNTEIEKLLTRFNEKNRFAKIYTKNGRPLPVCQIGLIVNSANYSISIAHRFGALENVHLRMRCGKCDNNQLSIECAHEKYAIKMNLTIEMKRARTKCLHHPANVIFTVDEVVCSCGLCVFLLFVWVNTSGAVFLKYFWGVTHTHTTAIFEISQDGVQHHTDSGESRQQPTQVT